MSLIKLFGGQKMKGKKKWSLGLVVILAFGFFFFINSSQESSQLSEVAPNVDEMKIEEAKNVDLAMNKEMDQKIDENGVERELLQPHAHDHTAQDDFDHDAFKDLPHDCQESIRIAQENEALEKEDDSYYKDEVDPEILQITQDLIAESDRKSAIEAKEKIKEFEKEIADFEESLENGEVVTISFDENQHIIEDY
jgi:hypothetical protein